jgi:GAF domain-containing protein
MPHDFDGETYDEDRDHDRLARQLAAVRQTLSDNRWWTLHELAETVGAPQQSASARIRDLRKSKHGSHTIERRYVSDGVWEYRMLPPLEKAA